VRSDALEYRIGADASGQLFDARHAIVTALGHDVCRAELPRERLSRFVPAHRDDPLSTQLSRRKHAEQTDRAVADHNHRRSRFYVRRVRGKPASAEDVGGGEKARHQVGRRHVRRGDQRAVCHGDAQQWGLRAHDPFPVCARCLEARAAMRARVVGRGKRPDHELAALDRRDRAADVLDDATVLVAHRTRTGRSIQPTVGPEIGSAHARSRQADDGVGRIDDGRRGALLETHVTRTVENSSAH
jgi:hypothetical protein